MRRSICGRSSLALGSVVMMRSLSMSEASWLRNMARRWPDVRPSFRFTIPCRIAFSLLAHARAAGGDAGHAERQPEARQDVFDLVERLAAEVLGGEHFAL